VKALRTLLALVGLAALAVAIALPFQTVRTPQGFGCGTAWAAARTEVTRSQRIGGERIDVGTACRRPAHRVLKQAGAAGAGGVLLLVLVAAWPAPRWRAPEVSPSMR
jgi:hypothetical protein